MSSQLEPTIWTRNTGQRIPWIDRCQLSITWISNIKEVHGKARLKVSYIWCLAAMLRDSVAAIVVVVVRTRPRAIPLAMITMRKFIHGFPFLSHDRYGAPLGGPSGRRSSAIKVAYRNLAVHISLNPTGRSFQWQLRRLNWTNLFWSFINIWRLQFPCRWPL